MLCSTPSLLESRRTSFTVTWSLSVSSTSVIRAVTGRGWVCPPVRCCFFGHPLEMCPWFLQKKHRPSVHNLFRSSSLNCPVPICAKSTSIASGSRGLFRCPPPPSACRHHGFPNLSLLPPYWVPITARDSTQFACWVLAALAQSSKVTGLGIVWSITAWARFGCNPQRNKRIVPLESRSHSAATHR